MKHYAFAIGVYAVLFVTGCLAQPAFPYMYPYPKAKITLHIVNQNNQPVTDTEIEASFAYCNHNLCKWPDENGYVTFESDAVTDVLFINQNYKQDAHIEKKQYYRTTIRKKFHTPSQNVKNGKWQPWNPTITMILKEKINPIPMYAAEKNRIKLPKINAWIGFDMEKNAWLAPYGKGEVADIEVYHQWDGSFGTNYKGSILKIRFPGEYAGCYTFDYEHNIENFSCDFRSPYNAIPENQYIQEISFLDVLKNTNSSLDKNKITGICSEYLTKRVGYIFRTRTKVDEQGNLISARYGKIYPSSGLLFKVWKNQESILHLHYYLNPTENDTNLEYDPNQNLLMEKVNPKDRWKYMNIAP